MDRDTKSKRARGLFDFLRARGKLWLLVGGVIVGVFLLLLGSGIGTQSKETGTLTDETAVYENAADLAAYQKELEKELAALCQSVAGVGQADVMVTLGSGRRVVYVTDENGEVATTGTGATGAHRSDLYYAWDHDKSGFRCGKITKLEKYHISFLKSWKKYMKK